MQSKRASSIEAFVSTISGYLIAVFIQLLIFPLFDLHPNLLESAMIAAIFTGISMVRVYICRRIFNWLNITGRLT
jgi:hypothetical protein